MNLDQLLSNAERAEGFLKALANRHRLMIPCELHPGECSVTALNQRLDLSQSALSQHLARLREDNLVQTRRESQTIYYSLANKDVERRLKIDRVATAFAWPVALVGLASFTGVCPLAMILQTVGVKPGCAFNRRAVLSTKSRSTRSIQMQNMGSLDRFLRAILGVVLLVVAFVPSIGAIVHAPAEG
eukprot:gene22012-23036_t